MRISYIALLVGVLLGGTSCDKRSGETIETAYVEPLTPPPTYRFARHGNSSVDIRECDLLATSINTIYTSYMKEARISFDAVRETLMNYYNVGYYAGYSPKEGVASSERHKNYQARVLDELDELITQSCRLSGLEIDGVMHERATKARRGVPGYVGASIGDRNVGFVTELGIAPAEVFRYRLMGAVYLDRMLNIYTDHSALSTELRKAHEGLNLVLGQNYTQLEHHWDLGYGYYSQWRSLLRGEGLSLLKGRDQRIYEAWVQGRIDLENYDYESLSRQLAIIRYETARAIAVRTMYHLIGPNTIANLREEPTYAFQFLSRALGLLYCMPYTLSPEGDSYMTHERAKELANQLLSGAGLWDTERLLSDEQTVGSLYYIAAAVGRAFELTPKDVYSN